MMSHIVEFFPITKLNSDLSQLHSADDAAIALPTNYGSELHTQEEEQEDEDEFSVFSFSVIFLVQYMW